MSFCSTNWGCLLYKYSCLARVLDVNKFITINAVSLITLLRSLSPTIMHHLHWQMLHGNARDNADNSDKYCTCLGHLGCSNINRNNLSVSLCPKWPRQVSRDCRCRQRYPANFCQWKHSLRCSTNPPLRNKKCRNFYKRNHATSRSPSSAGVSRSRNFDAESEKLFNFVSPKSRSRSSSATLTF